MSVKARSSKLSVRIKLPLLEEFYFIKLMVQKIKERKFSHLEKKTLCFSQFLQYRTLHKVLKKTAELTKKYMYCRQMAYFIEYNFHSSFVLV